MPTDPQPVTLLDVVARAVAVCDQSGTDAAMGDVLRRFEAVDEPIGVPEDARDRIYEELGALDPQEEDGALQLARAVAVYLCFRREQLDAAPGRLVREAVAAEFRGDVPQPVRAYLETSGLPV